MNEWKEYKLTDIANFKTGKLNSNAATEFGKFPFFTCSPITLRINEYAFDEEAILLAGNNAEGNFSIKYFNGKFNAYQRTYIITIKNKDKISIRFLYYAISQCLKEFKNISSGSATRFLTMQIFNSFNIYLPSYEIQLVIASIIGSLDNKIDLLHRQNTTLEVLAETLFRQWFIEEADDSWEIGKLEDEFTFVMGQSPLGEYINENEEGMVFYQGNADFDFRFPSIRVYTTEAKRTAKQFDTLVSVRAPVGDINMAFEECCLGRGVAAFRYRTKPHYYSYTYYKMRSLMQQVKLFEDSGTVFGSIGKDDFRNLKNIIPPQDIVDNFNTFAEPIDKKIYQNELQIRTLTQLRDTLLPKLMSGEVRVEV